MGWGPFLGSVNFTGNTIRNSGAGVAVSVVEGAGSALISGNMFDDPPGGAVIGCRWNEVVTKDLAKVGAGRFKHLTVERNDLQADRRGLRAQHSPEQWLGEEVTFRQS
jgi:hypothetical protein